MQIGIIVEAAQVLLTPANVLLIIIGVCLGMVAGSIPGFTGTNTVAIALPFTLPMTAEIALVFLSSLYVGANYGGAIPAILINTPGTSGATATVLDAYPMSQKGQAANALGISLLASVVGGFLAAVALLVLLDPIGDIAFMFTNREIFVLALFGLAAVAATLGDNLRKGLIAGFLGLTIAMMPVDPTTGQRRLDFGFFALYDEVPFIPIVVGLFAISELFFLIKREAISQDTDIDISSYTEVIEGCKYVLSRPLQTLRAVVIGTLVGAMPGSGATLANFLSWAIAKTSSKTPDRFGKGNPDGVIASEASNNAVTAGALVPTLALGIPGSGTTAVMLAALLLHGVVPGPELMIDYELEAYVIMVSLLLANIILLVFAFWISKYLVRVITLPASILVPSILVLTVVGTYAVRVQIFDIWLMILFGVIGFVMRKNDYPLVPLLLGVILGPIAEGAFLRSMLISGNDPLVFLAGPITKVLWALILLVLFGRPLYDRASDRFLS